jgi:hypothetical protein
MPSTAPADSTGFAIRRLGHTQDRARPPMISAPAPAAGVVARDDPREAAISLAAWKRLICVPEPVGHSILKASP